MLVGWSVGPLVVPFTSVFSCFTAPAQLQATGVAVDTALFHPSQEVPVLYSRAGNSISYSVGRSVDWLMCWSVGRSVAEDSEHATYGNRHCFISIALKPFDIFSRVHATQ